MEIIIESANIPLNVTAHCEDSHKAIDAMCKLKILEKYPVMPSDWMHLVYIQLAVFRVNPTKQLVRLTTISQQELREMYCLELTRQEQTDIVSLLLDHFDFCPIESIGSRERRIVEMLESKKLLKIVDGTIEKS